MHEYDILIGFNLHALLSYGSFFQLDNKNTAHYGVLLKSLLSLEGTDIYLWPLSLHSPEVEVIIIVP